MNARAVATEPATRRDCLKSVRSPAGADHRASIYACRLDARWRARPMPARSFAPNAFLRIAPDNSVTVSPSISKWGRASTPGSPPCSPRKLDADWYADQGRNSAPADATRYANLAFGIQGPAELDLANSWKQLRKAGPTARAMLLAAAGEAVETCRREITVENGVVDTRAGKRQTRSATWPQPRRSSPVPTEVELKDPKDFTLIGRSGCRASTRPAKIDRHGALHAGRGKCPGHARRRGARAPRSARP